MILVLSCCLILCFEFSEVIDLRRAKLKVSYLHLLFSPFRAGALQDVHGI